MGKYFFITVMLLSAVLLQASDSFNNLALLGKPPLARPEQRIRFQMQKNRKMFESNRDGYFDFLKVLRLQIEQQLRNALQELEIVYSDELYLYQNAVDNEIQAIEQAIEFEATEKMNKYLEYKKRLLKLEDFKELVKNLIEQTRKFLMQDAGSLTQKKEAAIGFNILNEILKKLK